jgi:AraC-like DNA-binding protein
VSAAGGVGFDVRSLACTYRDGHELPSHRHPWAQLVYARSGILHVHTDARVWFVPPTRAIWIPDGTPHAIRVRGEAALRTLYLAPARAAAIGRGLAALAVEPLLRELILRVVEIGMLDPRCGEHAHLAAVLTDRIAAAPGVDLSLPLPRDPRALRLLEHLRAEPRDPRDLETLARAAGASLRTLQRCVAQETGLTLEAWRQKARLVHSAAALATGASVTEAALECGYESASAYIAAFRRHFDVTPGEFGRTAREARGGPS